MSSMTSAMSPQELGRLPIIKMLHPDVADNHGGACMMLQLLNAEPECVDQIRCGDKNEDCADK